jgi:hypothetical protein
MARQAQVRLYDDPAGAVERCAGRLGQLLPQPRTLYPGGPQNRPRGDSLRLFTMLQHDRVGLDVGDNRGGEDADVEAIECLGRFR